MIFENIDVQVYLVVWVMSSHHFIGLSILSYAIRINSIYDHFHTIHNIVRIAAKLQMAIVKIQVCWSEKINSTILII